MDVGSKHEHIGYHILVPDGRRPVLYHIGDNPFQNDMLSPYEGPRVEVEGHFDSKRRDLFIVQEVRRLD
jgi:hypothetical protein